MIYELIAQEIRKKQYNPYNILWTWKLDILLANILVYFLDFLDTAKCCDGNLRILILDAVLDMNVFQTPSLTPKTFTLCLTISYHIQYPVSLSIPYSVSLSHSNWTRTHMKMKITS